MSVLFFFECRCFYISHVSEGCHGCFVVCLAPEFVPVRKKVLWWQQLDSPWSLGTHSFCCCFKLCFYCFRLDGGCSLDSPMSTINNGLSWFSESIGEPSLVVCRTVEFTSSQLTPTILNPNP